MAKIKYQFNINSLSKKYKCDVNKLIRYWKNEKNDFEISRCLGIDMLKIIQIRQEIAWLCEKERQKQIKKPR
ncbi:MAG: hypothetical protein QHH10_07640 [Peptococcaceae bacterium]|jgi:hypothetical protein|nr:hypothetical protein [Peptococcaceae bacterium]MDH7525172.1 hypothetical protein [Peptococcaceae bacterium]